MRGRTLALGLAAALMLISMQMAAAYNLRNDKTITQTIASGVSGWDPCSCFHCYDAPNNPASTRDR